MRVISSSHDYYDSVMQQGMDLTRVFKRETEEKEGSLAINNLPTPHKDIYVYSKHKWRGYETHQLGYIYVLIAGKLYGGIQINYKQTNKTRYIWTKEELDELKEELPDFFNETLSAWDKKRGRVLTYTGCINTLNVKGDTSLYDWSIENKVAIALCGKLVVSFGNKERVTIFNPVLKNYNFQKVLDPFTCFQELDMFISNLSVNEEIPELDDKGKIAAHGFDKWSFRKHKLDNNKENK